MRGLVLNEVEKLLKDKNIYYRVQGQDFLIRCLNPDHDDSDPSFRIDKIKGIGHCFSCGFKVNIFKHFGIISNFTNIRIAGLKDKLKACKVNSNGLPMLECPSPFDRKFRGISAETFLHFGAFSTDSEKSMEDRLIFPLKDVARKIRVYVGRHMYSDANPRYLNMPAGAKLPLFPCKLDRPCKYLVLVEGVFDMLNLYDKGLHAVTATMGTNGLKHEASFKTLPFKAQGVTHILIAYDGDKAGRESATFIKPELERLGFIVEILQMEDDTDPGGFSQEDVDGLKEYCEQFADKTA